MAKTAKDQQKNHGNPFRKAKVSQRGQQNKLIIITRRKKHGKRKKNILYRRFELKIKEDPQTTDGRMDGRRQTAKYFRTTAPQESEDSTKVLVADDGEKKEP